MNCLQTWPEPIVRVQTLAESGIKTLPNRYIRPVSQRPHTNHANPHNSDHNINININININNNNNNNNNIPVVSLGALLALDRREAAALRRACREWGFFQVVDHGVDPGLMRRARETWREFFGQPVDVKQEYANSPATYEGYGSRLGVEKEAVLDWSDYFFLNFMPPELRSPHKWPSLPSSCRDLITEYGNEVVKLCGTLMKVLSLTLGLEEDQLQNAFGGETNDIGACLRVNFYPKCPQPDLTLGLSSHSDPGGLTILLPDENVSGLQVRRGNNWITVKPVPNAFIVNIGDQIQVLSNAIYKSVEHRVIVNSEKDRVSLAFFYNPKSDILIEPMKQLVTKGRPSLYPTAMTYGEYRRFIRTKGPCGKAQVESLIKPSR